MKIYENKSKEELIQIIENFQKKEISKTEKNINGDELLAAITDLIFVFDINQRFIFVNIPRNSKLLTPPEFFIGKKHSEIMPAEIDEKFVRAFNQNKKGIPDSYTYKLNTNNNILTFSARMSPLYKNDKFNGSIAVVTDISHFQQTYDLLKKSESMLTEAAKVAKLGYWELDIVQNKLIWSEEVYKMFEFEADNISLSYEIFLEYVHPEDRKQVDKAYTDSLKNKTDYEIEHRLLLKDGRIKYLYEHCKTTFDKFGKPLISTGTVQDITEFKEIMLKLQNSEQKYRILAENTYDWEFWISPENYYNYLSPSCERITGYAPEEFIENPDLLFDIVHPDFKEKVYKHYHNENDSSMQVSSFYFPIYSKNGKMHWINHNCIPVFDEQGNFIGKRGINRDVSDIKLAEFKLKQQNEEYEALNEEYQSINEELKEALNIAEKNERLFREIFDTVPDPMSISTINSRKYLTINKGFTELTGYTAEEIIGKTVEDINLWVNIAECAVFIEKIKNDGFVQNFEAEFRMKDGKILPGLVSANVIEIDKIPHLLMITGNISEIKEAQNGLIQAEEKFRKAFHINPDSININRLSDGLYLDVNKGFENIMNYRKDEVVGKTSLELSIWKNVKDRERLVNELKSKGYAENLEAEFLTKNGETKIGLMFANIIKIGEENCVISITKDITKRKKEEKELQKYRENLEYLVKKRTQSLENSLKKIESLNAELSEKNKDLEKFHELFIEREFRIKELKEKLDNKKENTKK